MEGMVRTVRARACVFVFFLVLCSEENEGMQVPYPNFCVSLL
jgi:hypothetical protein